MNKKIVFNRSLKDLLFALGPSVLLLAVALFFAHKYANPAPPDRIILSTGDGEGNYVGYAKQYKEIIKEDGVTLEIRPSSGARENLRRLKDSSSDTEVAFAQDGLNQNTPGENSDSLVSLGSLYYEPLWIFYRGKTEITRLSQLKGKRLAVGERGGGTPALAMKLLKASGVEKQDAELIRLGWLESAEALKKGTADAAFFLATPDEAVIQDLIRQKDKGIRLVNLDQAEAITRQFPFLHHLTLPHGAIDLKSNLPDSDIHLIATTATLVARDSLHPALIDLLLKAATQIHEEPSLFEKKGEFPIDKDDDFPISDEAKRFYKSGTPFWQRYLPFWIATLVDRFIIVILPLLALILPLVKSIPKILEWRVRSRIHQRYGELKYLETQIKAETTRQLYGQHLEELDAIEDRVNQMKVPIEFSEHLYVLREHIEFVRGRLTRGVNDVSVG